jgi:hypothetical protein
VLGASTAAASSDRHPALEGRAQAPQIRLTGHPRARTKNRTTVIPFWAHGHPTSVTCRLDSAPARPCRSPARLQHLAYGPHRLRLHAANAFGWVTLTIRWTVLRTPPSTVVSTPVEVSPPEFSPPD